MGVMKRLATARSMGSGSRGIGVQFNLEMFFDRPAVERALSEQQRKYLAWAGSYTQRTMRSLIKRKGRSRRAPKRKYKADGKTWTKAYAKWKAEIRDRPASPPGTPPFTHIGLLPKAIEFAAELTTQSVLIGPTKGTAGDIGHLHDKGGVRFGRRYPARPFSRPARDKVAPKLPKFWKESFAA